VIGHKKEQLQKSMKFKKTLMMKPNMKIQQTEAHPHITQNNTNQPQRHLLKDHS